MSKFKELILQIKKYGEDPKPAPKEDEAITGPGVIPKSVLKEDEAITGPGVIPKPKYIGKPIIQSTPIKTMQDAITNFVTEVTKYNTVPGKDVKTGKPTRVIDPNDKRRDFNDFLTEQFAASADIHGEEYTTDDTATSKDSKLPTDLIQLSTVLDNLSKMGSSKNEKMTDGNWDFRTNNAVKNTYAIATALVAAHEALGGTAPNDNRIFRRSDLQQMKNNIPTQYDPPQSGFSKEDLSARAAKLTPLINKLTGFYKIYWKDVVTHPEYNEYIGGQKPLYKVTPGEDPTQLDDNQMTKFKTSKQTTLPFLRVMDKNNRPVNVDGRIALEALQSRNSLQIMMKNILGYSPSELNNEEIMRKVVKVFVNRIQKLLESVPKVNRINVRFKDSPETQVSNIKRD